MTRLDTESNTTSPEIVANFENFQRKKKLLFCWFILYGVLVSSANRRIPKLNRSIAK